MDYPQLPVDRNHSQDMQEQGKGKAPSGFYEIHPLGRIAIPGEGNTTRFDAKSGTIHGNKKWLTFWIIEGII